MAQAVVQQSIYALQRIIPLLPIDKAFEAAQQALLTEPQVHEIMGAMERGVPQIGLRIMRARKVHLIAPGPGESNAPEAISFIAPTRLDDNTSLEDVLKHISLVAMLSSNLSRALFAAHGIQVAYLMPNPTSDQPPHPPAAD